MAAEIGQETYKYVEIKGGAPPMKLLPLSAEDSKNLDLTETGLENSIEKSRDIGPGNNNTFANDNEGNEFSAGGANVDGEKSGLGCVDGPRVKEECFENVQSQGPNTAAAAPNIKKESRKIVEVNENEKLKYVEVNAKQEVNEVPATKVGNRIVIERQKDREYKPLDNGDDLIEIKSQERVKILTNYTIHPELFCEVFLHN